MLVGLVDPSHDERAADEPGRLPRWFPVDEVLERASGADPKWSSWPYELIRAAMDNWQDRDYISTTAIVGGCARSKVLERRADFVLTVDSMYASLRGTQVHRTLEFAARPGAVAEARFFTSIDVPKAGKVAVSCSPDIITMDGQLGDWKTTNSEPPYNYPYKSHTQQLNLNRYIVNHAERWELTEGTTMEFDPRTMRFKHLFVTYLAPKWPKTLELTRAQPVMLKSGKTANRQLPYVWTDEEVEEFMLPRLEGFVKALAAFPAWPKGLDAFPGFEGPPGWRCPGKPYCGLPDCLAKSYTGGKNKLGLDGLIWESP